MVYSYYQTDDSLVIDVLPGQILELPLQISDQTLTISLEQVETTSDLKQLIKTLLAFNTTSYPQYDLIVELDVDFRDILTYQFKTTSTNFLLEAGFVPKESFKVLDIIAGAYQKYLARNKKVGSSTAAVLANLYRSLTWIHYSPTHLSEIIEETPSSAIAVLTGQPDLLTSSERAFTPMTVLRKEQVNTIQLTEQDYAKVLDLADDGILFPATRYAEGMSKGLFFSSTEDQYCGTFYYLDYDSLVYLRSYNPLVMKNKVMTAKFLLDSGINDPDLIEAYNKVLQRYINYIQIYDDTIPESEVELSLTTDYWSPLLPFDQNYVLYDQNKYTNRFYAFEDLLDQVVCKGVAQLGYDVVVLQKMVGSRQIVTELLDVRSREESLANLIYAIN